MYWQIRHRTIDLTDRVRIMGILNTTPDSFSDGGDNFTCDSAIANGYAMIRESADILDIGGESTRPGADAVDADEEIRRTCPVICGLRKSSDVPISIDTTKAVVARAAIAAGADIINDVSGFTRDPDMVAVAAESGCGCVVMHMRGTPATMQDQTDYGDLFAEINVAFADAVRRLTGAGVRRQAICLDPGIGFAKTVAQNLALVNHLGRFSHHGLPLLLGPSRKAFIGATLNIDDPRRRHWGTAAAVACGVMRGAHIVRVHEAGPMREVATMAAAIAAAS